MENFEKYRSNIKKAYDQIRDINPDTAKEYLSREIKKPEYENARIEKNKAFREQRQKPKEDRENIKDLEKELSVAISKYFNNGTVNYLQNFIKKHGPQAPIELEGHYQHNLNSILSGSMSLILREKDVEATVYLLQLLKDAGAFKKEHVEKSIEKGINTLKMRDSVHGENNLNPQLLEEKLSSLKQRISIIFN